MRGRLALLSVCCGLFLASCQKEVDFPPDNGSGNGGGGNSSGDLVVRGVSVFPTNDSTVTTLQWDANKRLVASTTHGSSLGVPTDVAYTITRLADGKIKKIKVTSSVTAGFLDSTVYEVHYVPSSAKIAYHISLQYSFIGLIYDSVAYTYNPAGYVSLQEDYGDPLALSGVAAKQEYAYDANGNVTLHKSYEANASGGFDEISSRSYTYTAHKNVMVLGEESYVALGVENVSKNYFSTIVMTNTTNPIQNLTVNYTQAQYNSFDRPVTTVLNLTPQPPGYDIKNTYYYQ